MYEQSHTNRTNYYHNPVYGLNWRYNVNDKTNISNVLYYSTGRGGGTGPLNSRGTGLYATDSLDIDGNTVVLDESKITIEITRLQAEYDSQEYARNRKEEYPEMADQLDMIYHDQVNGTTTFKDAIDAIKTKYPKP